MLPAKDQAETVNVTFDFGPTQTALGVVDPALSSVAFSSKLQNGAGWLTTVNEATTGATHIVQISGGVRDSVYHLRCYATLANGERRLLEEFLPVK